MKTTIFILLMFLAVSGLAQPIQRTSWTTNGPNATKLNSDGTVALIGGAVINNTGTGGTAANGSFSFKHADQGDNQASATFMSDSSPGNVDEDVLTDDSFSDGSYRFRVREGQIATGGQQFKLSVGHLNGSGTDGWTNSFFANFLIGQDSPYRLLEIDCSSNSILFSSDYGTPTMSGLSYSGNGAGLTNIPFAKTFTSTNGYYTFTVNTDGSTNVAFVVTNIGQSSVPSSDIPNIYVTNNNNGAVVQTIAGTNSFKGSITISNTLGVATAIITNNLTVGGTISGNGSSLTNLSGTSILAPYSTKPVAVTIGASPFTFSNSTLTRLECQFSGSVAYSISKNGASIYGSLAGDAYFQLAPTNVCVITYSVAPTLFTNAW